MLREKATSRDLEGSQAQLVLVEVSPACDYAQGKIEVPRVVGGAVGGALVPVERLKKADSSEYLYSACGILKFDDNEVEGVSAGAYHFILNARFLSGVSKGVLSRRGSAVSCTTTDTCRCSGLACAAGQSAGRYYCSWVNLECVIVWCSIMAACSCGGSHKFRDSRMMLSW